MLVVSPPMVQVPQGHKILIKSIQPPSLTLCLISDPLWMALWTYSFAEPWEASRSDK